MAMARSNMQMRVTPGSTDHQATRAPSPAHHVTPGPIAAGGSGDHAAITPTASVNSLPEHVSTTQELMNELREQNVKYIAGLKSKNTMKKTESRHWEICCISTKA